jgi:hypothetical protein
MRVECLFREAAWCHRADAGIVHTSLYVNSLSLFEELGAASLLREYFEDQVSLSTGAIAGQTNDAVAGDSSPVWNNQLWGVAFI